MRTRYRPTDLSALRGPPSHGGRTPGGLPGHAGRPGGADAGNAVSNDLANAFQPVVIVALGLLGEADSPRPDRWDCPPGRGGALLGPAVVAVWLSIRTFRSYRRSV